MTAEVAIPDAILRPGPILTFIVPAPNGCDLGCSFCFIRQRNEEARKPIITPSEYSQFISDINKKEKIAYICIQGYEPLLPESFEYTREILGIAHQMNVPASLVTNGTHLAAHVEALALLRPMRVAVSLDASRSDQHDRQRRKEGAWKATIRGLRCAVKNLPTKTELVVTSVLMPKRRAQLDGIPALLDRIGVRRWVVTALQKIGGTEIGGPVKRWEEIRQDLTILGRVADRYGIEFVVDDEFGGFEKPNSVRDQTSDKDALRIRRLQNPMGVFSLFANGPMLHRNRNFEAG